MTFTPTEIIFSCTRACNLHCSHCFINRNPQKLNIEDAINFLHQAKALQSIEKIGFSGGEPFLYPEFLLALTKEALAMDLLFDQIMTNGDWWQTKEALTSTLQKLYDAGYDGKIGLSWDSYHGQTCERMETFIKTVEEIFGKESINIQTVIEEKKEGAAPSLQPVNGLPLPPETGGSAPRNAPLLQNDIPVYKLPCTYPSEDPRAWQARRWFKEDYCEGPGHILYVHADGNIAPCCGFANENPALFIGTIKDSISDIMEKAGQNKMIKLCYEEGLSHFRRHGLKKILRAKKEKLKGKCGDICSFCDYICKNIIDID